jgi:hypothetical protein
MKYDRKPRDRDDPNLVYVIIEDEIATLEAERHTLEQVNRPRIEVLNQELDSRRRRLRRLRPKTTRTQVDYYRTVPAERGDVVEAKRILALGKPDGVPWDVWIVEDGSEVCYNKEYGKMFKPV